MINFGKPASSEKLTAGLDLGKDAYKDVNEPQPIRKPLPSLFSIQMELEDIFMEIEENGGEVNDEILAKLAITEENFKQKLDNYRKAYTALTYEVEAGKKEKTRLDGIIKVRENNAKRLKNAMYEAVAAYGETGKSGNKVVNLIDSKLYTRKTEVCVVDQQLVSILRDLVLGNLRELWDNDMLLAEEGADSIDPKGFLDVINTNFIATYPDLAQNLYDKTGHYFTIDDLVNLEFTLEVNTNALDVLSKVQLGIINTYFDNEHIANISSTPKTATIKAMLKSSVDISYANLDYNESLIIK